MNGPPRDRDPMVVDWPPRRRARRRGWIALLALAAVLLFGGGTAISYYVDALWFDSLGYGAVFWKTLNVQATIFAIFAAATFVILYGGYLALKPARLAELAGGAILINGQPLHLPVEPVLRAIALGVSIAIALASGAGIVAEWPVLALYWYGSGAAPPSPGDPILGHAVAFYLFTLPAWAIIAGWLLTLSVILWALAVFFVVIRGGSRILTGRRGIQADGVWRGLSFTLAALLAAIAARVYLLRFDRMVDDHVIFTGVTYTEAHITLAGLAVVAAALVAGAVVAIVNGVTTPRLRWLAASIVPAAVCFAIVGILSWYMSSFIVKPNEIVRE